ncbi:right-handed parallel beta-helix repeat-containing protein [Engelhardtia mirabilis]|uniref:Right handed beta helix domain-containing protein n=1 Tax=Engelhardtia mirabilis TaxID=2528011 RepID=A0A518BNL6_9BACT|nr:hypothetical protein Pla133_36310 [Planctomycetes bacterium Pla133]QDV02858.1 hypothetical protein Pla86_36290 [Planctomycetes bacterium Pla86]
MPQLPLARSRSLALLAALTLGLGPLAAAQTIYVDAGLATGANDGSSWADAFQGPDGLQAALLSATPGEQVFAAQGSYLPTSGTSRTASFVLQSGVEVYGGFLGGEATVDERPPIGTAPSILTGDLAGNDGSGMFGENSFHVVTAPGADLTAVLDGFTVTSGTANGSGNNNKGGGIICTGGDSPLIRNCRFVANRCTFGGAAGYINTGSAPRFIACSFEEGNGGSFGGAFDIAGGGAVWYDRCLFLNNTANRAGALEVFSTNGVRVRNCVFRGNVATGGDGGGAIWVGSGGNTRIQNCTIVENSSTNQAAGGLRNQGANNTSVVNCIFWDNSGPGGAQGPNNQLTAGMNATYTIVEGGYAGTGNLAGDPQLVNVAGGDFTPGASSPAVDAGDNSALPATLLQDYVGNPRYVDAPAVVDTGSGTAPLIDIGAVELQVAGLASVSGCFGNPATLSSSTALQSGQSLNLQLDASAIVSGLTFFYVGVDGSDASGCGLFLPGLGEILLSLAPFPSTLGSPPMVAGQAIFSAPVPADPGLVGATLAFQAAAIDLLTTGSPIEFSNMLVGTVAP